MCLDWLSLNICICVSPVLRPQASRDPLAPEVMNEIFEDVKDMGVLIGKGGIYGQVTIVRFGFRHLSVSVGVAVVKEAELSWAGLRLTG